MSDAAPTRVRSRTQPVTPSRGRSAVCGLSAEAFAHPFDREAIGALRRLKGFDLVVGKVIEWQHERGAHVLHSASSIRITPRQLPRIHALLADACRTLNVEEPELYIANGPVNAYTSGHNNPYIVLNSDLVEVMDDAELQAVIGHELGHVKCKHVLYKEMVRWMSEFSVRGLQAGQSAVAAAGLKLLLRHLFAALTTWDQKAELSADRAAMLVVQDEAVCIRMLIKLAGAPSRMTEDLSVDAFLDQARHLHALTLKSGIADRYRRELSAGASHPLLVERAFTLDAWIQEGGYQDVLDAHAPKERKTRRPALGSSSS